MANWYYYNESGEKIEVTGGQLKGLAKTGQITPETIIETESGRTVPASKIQGLTFVPASSPELISSTQDSGTSNLAPVPAPIPTQPVPAVFVQNKDIPQTQGTDSAMMMEMMKEMIAANKNQQPSQIVITNTNTNTNEVAGQISYSLIMGFIVWFFFGFVFGGSCYLGRCSGLIVIIALVLAVVSAGVLAVVFWIVDFIIVLLTAINKPPTDCYGRKAIYI